MRLYLLSLFRDIEEWTGDSCPDDISLILETADNIQPEQLTPFVRLGYADFLIAELPVILLRLYNLLFANDMAEWSDLIDFVIIRSAGQTLVVQPIGHVNYEILIGFKEGACAENLNLQ